MATANRSNGFARDKRPARLATPTAHPTAPAASRSPSVDAPRNGFGPSAVALSGGTAKPPVHVKAEATKPINGKPTNGMSGSGISASGKPTNGKPTNGKPAGVNGKASAQKPEPKILFQRYFHSVGPRTYAAQVKELSNGNHLLVLTEGKRDEQTGELRKSRLLIFGEDFSAFFGLLKETAGFIRANPLPEEVRERRQRFWNKKAREAKETRASGR